MVDAGAAGCITTGSGAAGTTTADADVGGFFVVGADVDGFFVVGAADAGGFCVVGAGATGVCLTADLCTGLDLCGRLLGADRVPEWALAGSLFRVNIGGCFIGLKFIPAIVMYVNDWSHRRPLLSPILLPLLPLR